MKLILRLTLFFFLTNSIVSQNRILLDEDESDWMSIAPAWTSSVSTDGISLNSFKITNDNQFLFIYFKCDNVYSLQNVDGIKLYIDSDNNSATGLSKETIGAEIEFNFGRREGVEYLDGKQSEIAFADLFLVTCPTIDSDWFEVALSRNSVINDITVFGTSSIKIILSDESVENGSSTDVIGYTFADGSLDPLPEYSFSKKSAEDLRVVSHNVEFDGFFEDANKPAFERLYSVIDPDIIGFSEIYNHSGEDVANRLEEILPSPDGESWNSTNIADNFVAARYTIKGAWSAGGFGNGVFLLDLRPDYNTDALVVVAHPPCCDNDYARQLEIDGIMSFIRDAKLPGGNVTISENTPIIVVGDMNLVGSPQQVTTLLTGDIVNESAYGSDFTPDWNGESFRDAKPLVTGLPMTFTQGIGDYPGAFSKGRLDFIIYTGSVLDLQNSFVLYTNSLSQSVLENYGLLSGDTESAADHFPVVADFTVASANVGRLSRISTLRYNDSNGSPQLLGSIVNVDGIVTVAQEFGNAGPAYIQDESAGISIYGEELISGLQIGDEIIISTPLGFYNGLTQLVYDAENSSVMATGSGNSVQPVKVTIEEILDQNWDGYEEYEGMLVEIKDVTIAESGIFTAATNYSISDGQNSMVLRIDNAINLAGEDIPEGEFTVVGIISQFDNSSPYSEGYIIYPRFVDDITVKQVSAIADARINDDNGIPVLLNEIVTVRGVVTVSSEFGAAGPCYLQDGTGGLAVYGSEFVDQLNPGDSITITSKLVHYNGLAELSYDESNTAINMHGSNIKVQPKVVTITNILNQAWNGLEVYEGMLVKVDNATIAESGEFTANTNYTLTDSTGSMILRIDNDVNLVGQEISNGALSVTAIVAQYDSEAPYSEGYQLLPRNVDDIKINQVVKSIELTSPAGGAEFLVAAEIPINWMSENVESVNISYVLPDGSSETIVAENIYAASGEYKEWTAPGNVDSLVIVIKAVDDENVYDQSGVVYIKDPVGVGENSTPDKFTLYNNYPNPFNPATTIKYYTPGSTDIKIDIYNSVGEKVFGESFANKSAGYYEFNWDASSMSSGLYFCTILATDYNSQQSQRFIRKMLLVK